MIPTAAIEKAIDGGWKPAYEYRWKYEPLPPIPSLLQQSIDAAIAFDPSFWKCLGQALEWPERNKQIKVNRPREKEDARKHMIDIEENHGVIVKMDDREIIFEPYRRGKKYWYEYARAFYDLILRGAQADEFWGQLLENSAEQTH